MSVNLILWICVIWLPLLVCLILCNEAKMKKSIVVGVTLPREALEQEQLHLFLKQFKSRERWVCLALLLAGLPGMLIRDFDWMMFVWGLWLVAAIVVPYIPYIICHKKLKQMKSDFGWKKQPTSIVTVNTAALAAPHWVSPLWFLLPLVISLIPWLWEREAWPLYLVSAGSILLLGLLYRFSYRNKAERVNDNIELTRALTELRQKNWARSFLVGAYAMALLSLVLSFDFENPVMIQALVILIVVGMMAAAIWIELQTRKLQQQFTEQSGQDACVDEDDCWIWGLFYYNPRDSHLVVNQRVGLNSTFNLAHPVGKVVTALFCVLLLMIPFMIPITEAIFDRPPELRIEEQILIASSGGKEYEISVGDIESVELREKLPNDMVRIMGTGMENLSKGKFKSETLGRLELCLDPTCGPFILIDTGEEQYLLGTRDSEYTELMYQQLLDRTE